MKQTLHRFSPANALSRALLLVSMLAPAGAIAQHNTGTPQHVYTTGATTVFGMPFASPDPLGQRVQVIYRPSELKLRTSGAKSPSGRISRIYFRTPSTASGSFTMSNVFIKLGQTTDTGYVGDNVGESPFKTCTEVFRQASYKVSTPGWIEFTLTQPFQYDNTRSLIVEFGGTNGFRPVVNNHSKRMIFGAVGNAKGANITFLHDLGFDMGATTAIPELAGTEMTVYPNPAAGSIRVQGPVQQGRILLRDLSGREVLNATYTPSADISISKLEAGLYFYTLLDQQLAPVAGGKLSVLR